MSVFHRIAGLLFVLTLPAAGMAYDWPVYPDSSGHPIGNGYGQYQWYEGYGDPLFHTGIDILVPVGTPVYAVKAGYVKAIMTTYGSTHYRIVIGDSAGYYSECDGFMYSHMDYSSMVDEAGLSLGDTVGEGQFIGRVVHYIWPDDPGIEFDHLHFSKVHSADWYHFDAWEYIANPLDFIDEIVDSEPPVFENAVGDDIFGFCRNIVPMYFYQGETLTGEVDIICRVYDIFNHPGWPVNPQQIEYRIEGETSTDWINSVCFSTPLGLYESPIQNAVNYVYQNDQTCQSLADFNNRVYFFNVTNTDGDSLIEISDGACSWRTMDFQNGTYTVHIRAGDAAGNSTEASMTVSIENFYDLDGVVVLSGGGPDMSGTVVVHLSSGRRDTTDATGAFSFLQISGGNQAFMVHRDGYWPGDTIIMMNTDNTLDIVLQPIDFVCGDANGDGAISAADVEFLHRYLFAGGDPPNPMDAGNADICGGVHITDLVLLARHIFTQGTAPCESFVWCDHPVGGNRVNAGCPWNVPFPDGDSIPLSIYLSNDMPLGGVTLGFHHNSDDAEVTSVDFTGSMLTGVFDTLAAVISLSDNSFLIYGYALDSSLGVQSNGLLATAWLQVPSTTPEQVIDMDTVFFAPGGEFMFAPSEGGIIRPAYADCGAQDIIVTWPYVCGDANGDDVVNVADAVSIINYIFKGESGPEPLCLGDASGDNTISIADAVFIINYIFKEGPPPIEGCCR